MTDVMEYVVPGQKGKKLIASSDDGSASPSRSVGSTDETFK